MFGTVDGRHPDAYVYIKSGLKELLRTCLVISEIKDYIYGDTTYALRPWLKKVYPDNNSTPTQEIHNTFMNCA